MGIRSREGGRSYYLSRRSVSVTVLLVLLACTTRHIALGQITINFGEFDYRPREDDGQVTVAIDLDVSIVANFTVRLTPLTYDQFLSRYPGEITPTGAAAEPTSDFDTTPVNVTILGSQGGTKDFNGRINIVDDNVEEPEEGFMLVMDVLGLTEEEYNFGVISYALVSVIDDDDLQLKFSKEEYTVTEGAGVIGDVIEIVSLDGVVSIRDKPMMAEGAGIAFPDEAIAFPAFKNSTFLPINILDDNVFEDKRMVVITVFSPEQPLEFNAFSSVVTIMEDDEVKVGFNTTEIKDGTLTIYLESTGAEYEASGSIGFLVTLSSEVPGGVPLSNVAILSTSESTSSTTFSVETVTSNLGFEVTATLVSLSNNPAIVVDPEKNTLTIVFEMPTPTPSVTPSATQPTTTPLASPSPTPSAEPTTSSEATTTPSLSTPPSPPPPPVIQSVVVVNKNDLNFTWIPPDHPVDQYGVLITTLALSDQQKRRRRENQQELEANQEYFETNKTYIIYENADLTLLHRIEVRSELGELHGEYSEPFNYTHEFPESTKQPEGQDTAGFPWWWWILIAVIVALLLCCLLWILLLCCCCCSRRSDGGNYYPSKKEKKFDRNAYDHQKFNEMRSPSVESDMYEYSA